MFSKWLWHVDAALLGSACALYRANKLVNAKLEECVPEHFEKDERLKHSKQNLDAMLTVSVQRLERIENKAMGTLLGVAVAIAVFGATSGLLGPTGLLAGYSAPLRNTAAVALVIAMLYLLGSGLLALGAYQIGRIYRPTLLNLGPIVDAKTEAMMVLYSIEQNQRAATLRANKLSASFACLRNGLIAVLALGMVVVCAGILNRAPAACG